jgi:serine/threonine protein kinase
LAAFAHERGVLHRDLKPTNVFITVDERVKVLDFGVALTLDTDPGPATRAAGTPGYMAPEQRDGGMQDARTDVWAAALLLVECLTGRRIDDGSAVLLEISLKRVDVLPIPQAERVMVKPDIALAVFVFLGLFVGGGDPEQRLAVGPAHHAFVLGLDAETDELELDRASADGAVRLAAGVVRLALVTLAIAVALRRRSGSHYTAAG